MVADQSDAASGVITGLSALPPDVAEVIAEMALKASRENTSRIETSALPDGEPLALVDQTQTDRSQTLVFSMQDGEPREVMTKERPRLLRKRLPDGRPAFWVPGMPGRPPSRNVGTWKCFLHPESDERKLVDEAGYAGRYCNDGDPSKKNRDNFRALSQKEQHERRKHPNAWEAVQRIKAEKERQEAIQLQRDQLAAMQGIARMAAGNTFECEFCDEAFPTQQGLRVHVGRAHKEP